MSATTDDDQFEAARAMIPLALKASGFADPDIEKIIGFADQMRQQMAAEIGDDDEEREGIRMVLDGLHLATITSLLTSGYLRPKDES